MKSEPTKDPTQDKMVMKCSQQAFHDMAANTDRSKTGEGSIVVVNCESCSTPGKVAKRFGTLQYILYIPDSDGLSHLGVWRCDVKCLECSHVNRDICFAEVRPRHAMKTPPTLTEWKATDWQPR